MQNLWRGYGCLRPCFSFQFSGQSSRGIPHIPSRHMQVYNKDVVRVQKCSVVTAKSYLEKSTVFVIYSDVLIMFLRGEYWDWYEKIRLAQKWAINLKIHNFIQFLWNLVKNDQHFIQMAYVSSVVWQDLLVKNYLTLEEAYLEESFLTIHLFLRKWKN